MPITEQELHNRLDITELQPSPYDNPLDHHHWDGLVVLNLGVVEELGMIQGTGCNIVAAVFYLPLYKNRGKLVHVLGKQPWTTINGKRVVGRTRWFQAKLGEVIRNGESMPSWMQRQDLLNNLTWKIERAGHRAIDKNE